MAAIAFQQQKRTFHTICTAYRQKYSKDRNKNQNALNGTDHAKKVKNGQSLHSRFLNSSRILLYMYNLE